MNLIYFAPHSGIWEHSLQEGVLLDSLNNLEVKLTYISCDGAFKGLCVTRRAHGLDEYSHQTKCTLICRNCNIASNQVVNHYKFNRKSIINYISKEDFNFINTTLKTLDKNNALLYQFVHHNALVGHHLHSLWARDPTNQTMTNAACHRGHRMAGRRFKKNYCSVKT